MLKIAIVVLLVLVVGVLVVASMRPGEFAVQRSVTVGAPPERIYPMLVDFRQWPAWSPWEKIDPTMTRTLGGAASGVGATYAWSGTGKVGAGRMEILEAAMPNKVSIQLDFIKPFEGHNIADFTLAPTGGQTEVNWRMHGPAPFMS